MSDGLNPDGLTLTRLDRLDARLVTHDWAWARDNAERIDAHWDRRVAEKPALFDGRVLLARACRVTDGACTIELFETRFSAFLTFRESGSPDPSVTNAFAAVVPWSRDGAAILGVMGRESANADQIYFPCGTPDGSDVRPGARVDLAGSATRELLEETGLILPPDASDAWVLVSGAGQHAFLRPVVFPEDAAALVARMARHRAAEAEPELAGFFAVRSPADFQPDRMPGFVRAYLGQTLLGQTLLGQANA
ncbi:NUDIX hydrolase [Methylobacterium sp. J-090]|uniref:NUDIX hydrolase n=1 Tax=Methylobacterium sp. J-090 TaxID=2836666 RepID=UPI001FB9853D|nr:NUDIX hydrolase [Methylobacterium sp. J-090]MCJ2080712.1 NUDIX hydrolase [Methylobacterium sp. J-090]